MRYLGNSGQHLRLVGPAFELGGVPICSRTVDFWRGFVAYPTVTIDPFGTNAHSKTSFLADRFAVRRLIETHSLSRTLDRNTTCEPGANVMGQHVLCVIESELDSSFDRLQLELAMYDRDWIPVDGMDAFYRHFEFGLSDDLAIEQAEADLKNVAEELGGTPPEAVLAIA